MLLLSWGRVLTREILWKKDYFRTALFQFLDKDQDEGAGWMLVISSSDELYKGRCLNGSFRFSFFWGVCGWRSYALFLPLSAFVGYSLERSYRGIKVSELDGSWGILNGVLYCFYM